jgi:hypothetical protein
VAPWGPRLPRRALFVFTVLLAAVAALFATSLLSRRPLPASALLAAQEPGAALVAELPTTSPSAASRWLSTKLNESVPPIDLSLVSRELRSVGLVRLPGRETAGRLEYVGASSTEYLFVLSGRRWNWAGWEPLTAGRYHFRWRAGPPSLLLTWGHEHLTYALVTKQPAQEAIRLAQQAARACTAP